MCTVAPRSRVAARSSVTTVTVQRLRAGLPGVVGEAAVGPQLGQHHEVGAGLGPHQGGHPVDAVGQRLVVAVGQLDDVDSHGP